MRRPKLERAGTPAPCATVRAAKGFTIVELLVSASLTLCVTAAIFAAAHPTEGVFSVETESVDLQQRLRVATGVLFKDLVVAGAGIDAGADAGPLAGFLPPILPYRQARADGDAAGTFRSDTITLLYVPSQRGQTTIASAMPAASGVVRVNIGFGCPLTDAACGLSGARMVLIYDTNGSFDRFRVDNVEGSLLELRHSTEDSSKVYPAGSRVVEVVVRSYFLKADESTDTFQLMRDDGDGDPSVPVVDHVVQLGFEYFGDPRPPDKPLAPGPTQQPTLYPAGENCVVRRDVMSVEVPRLPTLESADASGLVELTAARLTDGPWCPDAEMPNRFDADLLRIRRIAVTVRVESAIAALRGPAGTLFSRPGTSTSGNRFLPDQTVRFQVSPRNMGLVR